MGSHEEHANDTLQRYVLNSGVAKHATSVNMPLHRLQSSQETNHNVSRNRARTQVLLQARKLHVYASCRFGAFWIISSPRHVPCAIVNVRIATDRYRQVYIYERDMCVYMNTYGCPKFLDNGVHTKTGCGRACGNLAGPLRSTACQE